MVIYAHTFSLSKWKNDHLHIVCQDQGMAKWDMHSFSKEKPKRDIKSW
jgi:hypothetical protein